MILVLSLVGTVSATNWSVDDSGEADFIGIQDAINNASAGDTILVHSGVYYENVVVDKSVILKGIGQPVVDASGEMDAITLSAEGITLEGFDITNAGSELGGGVLLGKRIRVISCNNNLTGNIVCENDHESISLSGSDNVLNRNKYIILTQKECEVDVNSIRIPNLLLQSSLQPYAIIDIEIYNFKNTEMFAYFSEFAIYANGEIIGSKKESEEDLWPVEVNEKREEKIYLDVTGEKLAELLENDDCLTVNVSLHIYGYANENSYTGIERSETDMQFEKIIVPFIYNYSSSQVLNKTENMPEAVLTAAEDILHKRLGFFKVIDYYIMRNNSCIRIYFENESREIINDICRHGKVEFRSKTNPMATIEIGMELSEIHNITEPIFDYNDIINRSVVLCRPEISPWGVSFTLSREGAENLQDAVKRYEYDTELSEAYKFHILTLIDDKVAYDMSMSRDLFRMLSRDKPVYCLQMSIGPDETGYKEARNLICYLKTGPLPEGSANYDWYEALSWIKENTPDPCVDYYVSFPRDKTYPESAYSVMSWCDYGNWITCIAHRIPVANNINSKQTNSQVAATFFITSNESEANEIADAFDVRYVVSDFPMADAFNAFYNKFGVMTVWFGDTEGYYTQVDTYDGPLLAPSTKYFSTMVARLHIFDGRSVALSEEFYLEPLRHYRHIHESPITILIMGGQAIKYVKVFEYVKGVRIKGTAPNVGISEIGPFLQYWVMWFLP
jgi:hypothetical protein